jgi:hypothetical protein
MSVCDPLSFEQKVLDDKCTSRWLNNQVSAIDHRDLCDAINDVEALLAVLNERLNKQIIKTGLVLD